VGGPSSFQNREGVASHRIETNKSNNHNNRRFDSVRNERDQNENHARGPTVPCGTIGSIKLRLFSFIKND